jgi:hypothetical protein
MTILDALGLDWPISAYYLLPSAVLAIVLAIMRRVADGRAQLRRLGAGATMVGILLIAWTVELSPDHVSRFEEGLLAAASLVFVLILDWRLTAKRDK